MKNLGIVTIFLMVLAIGFTSCLSIDTIEETGIKYNTIPSEMPTNIEFGAIGLAKELLNVKDKTVVINGGDNPIPTEDWDDFNPRYPWKKNLDRFTLFDSTTFYRSPNVSKDCTDCFTEIEYKDYSWLELAEIVGVAYIPDETDILKPEEGHVVIKTVQKCQILLFKSGSTIYDLTDNKGNSYIMHAIESGEPNLAVELPEGWTLESRVLTEDFILMPFGGGDFCYYNILGDNLGQGYHQYKYADTTYPSE